MRDLTLEDAETPRTAPQLAALLADSGAGTVPAETIRRHLREGAPADSRGRISLTAYAAWLLVRLGDSHANERK
ncbi:MAG TPA: hypothetical protein PK082_00650 [Phycisphaerae bacterium]|nr:hypothetical protein [Phycisphaerae bacterium]